MENKGLTSEQVCQRVENGQVNGCVNPKTKSVKQIFIHNIFTFFNLINLILAVAVFIVGSPKNAMFALVIVFNTAIGIFQEIRAKRIIDRLTLISAPKAHVIRNGTETEIPTEEIVMDELVIFRAGSQAAADCVVVDGECEVNESLISGEADPVYKTVGETILSGSFVVSGEAFAKASALGSESFSGKITKDAKYIKKPHSEMMTAINRILKWIAICIVPVAALLFYNSILISGQSFERAVTSTVAALIGMIPEGLVLLSSVVLAVSAIRLAHNKTLVQNLYCIETLARVDVLCLDKTGTITEGEMAVEEIKLLKEHDISDSISLTVNAMPDDNPTVNALRSKWSEKSRIKPDRTVPFSSAKKWSGAYFKDKGSFIFGAGEFILGEGYREIEKDVEDFSGDGRRIILFAHSENDFNDKDLPKDITPLALIAINDKIRPEAPETLRYFAEQGVEIKIISGDNPKTVSDVAKKAGVLNADRYTDLSKATDIGEIIDEYTVFGRVTPDKKLEIIKALKKRGHTVGMTGDGVNDVLALREADCSVAMQSGSEAARNVSNLVLIDSNFASLPKVVAEGRRSINNIERSAALFLSKTVYSLLLAVIFIFIQLPFLFEPIQMTLVNALCIGVPSFLLALQPNKDIIKGSFIGNAIKIALPNGLTAVIALVAVLIFSHIMGLSTSQMSSLATVVLATVSFTVTARCCRPFRLWKGVMLAVLIGGFIFGSVIFCRFFGMTVFTAEMTVFAAVIGACSIAVMYLLSVLTLKISEKIKRKRSIKNGR